MNSFVRHTFPDGKIPPLTADEIRQVEDAAKCPVVYDEDCPKLTSEQLNRMYRVADKERKRA